ncbi:hypothetical protein DB347_06085 [Opitutaceae bacterium EW11]|nr:hypothetical protein DB347_06085 [Opitutaceae bacterium EW11]
MRRLVTTVCEGTFNLGVIRGDMEQIRAHPDFRPSYSQLIDLRRAVFDLGPKEILECSELNLFDPAARRAIVASTDLSFGMSRMFATYREIQGEQNLMVFRTLEEALQWLAAEAPSESSVGPDTPSLF